MGWRKSSYSANNGCCVEVATDGDLTSVRDSKDPQGGILRFSPVAWSQFLAEVKAGQFDRPV